MGTFRGLLLGLVLFSVELHAVNISKLISCRFSLLQGGVPPARKAAYIGYIDRLKAPGGMSQANRVQVLSDFSRDPLMREAVEEGDRRAADILSTILQTNGDMGFRQATRPHLEGMPGIDVARYLDELDNSNPPDAYSKADQFPKDAFSVTPSSAATEALQGFVSNDGLLSSRMFTRRVFSFMGANKEMSREAKVNFCKNLVSTFHGLQNKMGKTKDELLVFEHKKTADGLDIFCGHNCAFYFVIDEKSNFYSGGTGKPYTVNSWPEVQSNWRGAAQFIFMAGQEASLN